MVACLAVNQVVHVQVVPGELSLSGYRHPEPGCGPGFWRFDSAQAPPPARLTVQDAALIRLKHLFDSGAGDSRASFNGRTAAFQAAHGRSIRLARTASREMCRGSTRNRRPAQIATGAVTPMLYGGAADCRSATSAFDSRRRLLTPAWQT